MKPQITEFKMGREIIRRYKREKFGRGYLSYWYGRDFYVRTFTSRHRSKKDQLEVEKAECLEAARALKEIKADHKKGKRK